MRTSSVRPWLALSLPWVGPALAEGAQKLNRSDQKFFDAVASSNLLEIELGRLAVEKGVSTQVKEFGRTMVDEYTRANDDLRKIADAKGIMSPTAMNQEDRKVYDKVARLTGEKLDKEYLTVMVKIHNADLKTFDGQAKRGVDADLKDYASRALPILRQDRDTASRDVKRM